MFAAKRLILTGLVTAGVVLATAGCNSSTPAAHAQEVKASNEHWLAMRSAIMVGMAQKQFDTGDLEQAEKTLSEAVQVDGSNPRLLTLVGRISLERGQLERASQRFTEAIAMDAKAPEPHYFLGIVMQRWQRYDKALDQYQMAFDLEHDNIRFLLAISEMLVASDRVDEAVALLSSKVVYFDQSADIRVTLGELMMMKKDYAGAVKYFQQAMLLRPDDQQIMESLALSQLKAGQTDQAIHSIQALCLDKGKADRPDLKRLLAKAYLQADRPADAREVYVKLTQADPSDAEAWIRLGEIAWSLHDAAGTMLAANRAVSLSPQSQEGYMLMGMVWEERGRLDEALRLYDRAAELAPQSPDPVVMRGIALEKAGRNAAAAEAYAQALRRQPDDDRIKSLLAKVSAER